MKEQKIIKEIKIIRAGSEIDSKWDEYVRNHAGGTIYHNSSWLTIIEMETGHKILKLASIDSNNDINGIFPLQYTTGFPFGIGGVPGAKRLSSLPRTPIGGPLSSNSAISRALIEKAVSIASDGSDRLLQIKSYSSDLNNEVNLLNKYLWREIYIKEIPDYRTEMRFGSSKSHSAVKRAVNKAKKNGVTFRVADSLEDLKNWYQLYLETMRHNANPARTFSFFNNIWDILKPMGLMQLVLAELEENEKKRPIAGNILFFYNKVVTYAFNGGSRKHFGLRPNDILHWEAIHNAQREGYKLYDLGEVSKDNSGLAAYKKKWSSKVWELYHYYYPKPKKFEDDDLDLRITGGLKRKLFQLLPLPFTEIVGKLTFKKL